MGLDDLLEFDGAVYADKLRNHTDAQLKIREVEKTRQFLLGFCSLGISIGTGGLSAIWMGFSARNLDVARQKLKLIQAELMRRGVPLKQGVSGADTCVTVMEGFTSLAVGGAVQEGFAVKRTLLRSVYCDSCKNTIRQGSLYGDANPKLEGESRLLPRVSPLSLRFGSLQKDDAKTKTKPDFKPSLLHLTTIITSPANPSVSPSCNY